MHPHSHFQWLAQLVLPTSRNHLSCCSGYLLLKHNILSTKCWSFCFLYHSAWWTPVHSCTSRLLWWQRPQRLFFHIYISHCHNCLYVKFANIIFNFSLAFSAFMRNGVFNSSTGKETKTYRSLHTVCKSNLRILVGKTCPICLPDISEFSSSPLIDCLANI